MSYLEKYKKHTQETLSQHICDPSDVLISYDKITISLSSSKHGSIFLDCVIQNELENLELSHLTITNLPNQRMKGLGIAKQLLQNMFELAKDMVHSKLTLSTEKDGGFVWPWTGFGIVKHKWPSVKEDLLEDLNDNYTKYKHNHTGKPMSKNEANSLISVICNWEEQNPQAPGTAIIPVAHSAWGKSLLKNRQFSMALDFNNAYQMEIFNAATTLTKEQKIALTTTVNTVMGRNR